MKKQKVISAVLVILILATLAFIWGNSLQTIPESSAKSEKVLKAVTPTLEIFVGKGNATDHLVRKIAHFIEFSVLGIELALFMTVRKRVSIQSVSNCLFAGLSTAVIDESLQLISNRGSQVVDVLLDFCGVVVGISIILVFYALTNPKKRYRASREQPSR